MILLHNNASPYVGTPLKIYLDALNWKVLPNPLLLPDIALSNYQLFGSMAHGLPKQRFTLYKLRCSHLSNVVSVCIQKDVNK